MSLLRKLSETFRGRQPMSWPRYLETEQRVLGALERNAAFADMARKFGAPVETFRSGFAEYSRTGKTNHDAFVAMRQLHMTTKGESDALFASVASTFFPIIDRGPDIDSRTFGSVGNTDFRTMMKGIETDGIRMFPSLVAPEAIADIRAHLKGLPVVNDNAEQAGKFPELDDSPRVFFSEADLLRCKAIRALVLDPLIVQIARAQLKMEPIFESVSVFHTRPHRGDGATLNSTAQMYHIDRDRLNFLNFFIYIGDVTEAQGPHWFVKGSHTHKPDDYWQDRRFSDAEIAQAYEPDDVLCVTGPAGTTFAANTSAFHKGSPPIEGSRTVLQIRYTSSLFGASTRLDPGLPFEDDLIRGSDTMMDRSRALVRFAANGSA